MIEICNTSMQFLYIPFKSSNGLVEIGLRPKEVAVIPNSYTSIILNSLVRRRQVKIRQVEEFSAIEAKLNKKGR
jgi:hypothetical protein